MTELSNLLEIDARTFLENAEEAGLLDELTIDAFAIEHDLDEDEIGALRAELAERGVEIVESASADADGATEDDVAPVRVTHEASGTTDSLTLFMNAAGRYPLLTAAEEVMLAKRVERGDACREGADDQLEPAPRRLDREALPGPRPAAGRPRPGGRDRAEPCRREVRLAPRLQVLDVRHLVDPPGLPACGREPVGHDPRAGTRPRAAGQAGARAPAARGARPATAPTEEELAAATGLELRHVEEALGTVEASVSLNQSVGDDDGGELGDLFADSSADDPAEVAGESLRRESVRTAVRRLPERERRLLELRFGFDGEPTSLEAIGKELGLTRERVRQLEAQALSRLAGQLEGLVATDEDLTNAA